MQHDTAENGGLEPGTVGHTCTGTFNAAALKNVVISYEHSCFGMVQNDWPKYECILSIQFKFI